MKDKLLKLDALLADISVKGDDVNKMFAARRILLEVFNSVKEDKDGE